MAETAILAALTTVGNATASELVKRMFSELYDIDGCCSCRPKVGFSNLKANVIRVDSQLCLIQEFIKDTDLHDQSNGPQEAWVKDVRELAYEIEDIIAEFVYLVENKSRGRRSHWLSRCAKSSDAFNRVASQVQEAASKIDFLVEQRKTWVSTTNSSRKSNIPRHSNERWEKIVAGMSRSIPEDNIVGIEEKRLKLTSMLNSALDLEGMPIETVPNEVGDLFNLHYLGLRDTMVKTLPKCIEKLHNLKTLDLYHSQIEKLPDGITELKKLRHLFAEVLIDNTYKSIRAVTGVKLPKNMFYLKEIHTVQAVESNDMVVRELGNLTQLRTLRIVNVKEEHSRVLCKSLSKMSFLSCLAIYASNENEILDLEGLHLPQIQKLELTGKLAESALNSPLFQTSGEAIQNLWLSWSQLQNDPLQSLFHLRNLTVLSLNKAYEGQQLIFQHGWFPKLKYLVLKQMTNLTNVEMKLGTMESLEEIALWELRQLEKIPEGMEHLRSLKWMVCEDMPANFGGMAKGWHRFSHFTCIVP